MNDFILEKIIEDILSIDKGILAEVLRLNSSGLSQIARQKTLNSGKLDLLYMYENELLLIELKAVEFYERSIQQISNYYSDLINLQKQNKLINAKIRKILLVTKASDFSFRKCEGEEIQLVVYDPRSILLKYYENFKELAYFLKLQSGDYGVVRLGLVKSTLHLLSQGKNIQDICKIEGKSLNTIKNRLSIAVHLGIIAKFDRQYFLTDFGNTLLGEDSENVQDNFTEKQIDLLSNYLCENPFYSSITYTIYSIIESVFILAKSEYPVPFLVMQNYFVRSVGKWQTWKTEKARNTATYIFSNYACELGFLAKVDNCFYITPKGIRSILLLQLNRSLKLIKASDSE
ncbi:MAG: hypothetical protein NTW14_09790 [bacterium]|nr:hypothetical protein [bacterium]